MTLNLANILTLFRIVAIPAIIAMMLIDYPGMDFAACCLYIASCLTDYLDGMVARMQNLHSDFGRILDPVADKLLVSSTLITLAYCGHLVEWTVIAAILILGRELLISGLRDYLSTKGEKIPSSRLAKWKTFIQMTGIGFLIAGDQSAVWLNIPLQILPVSLIGVVLLWFSVIPTWITGVQYIMKTFSILKHEKA